MYIHGINILLDGILPRQGSQWKKVYDDSFGHFFFQTIQRVSEQPLITLTVL